MIKPSSKPNQPRYGHTTNCGYQ